MAQRLWAVNCVFVIQPGSPAARQHTPPTPTHTHTYTQPENIAVEWETNFICLSFPLLKTCGRKAGLDFRREGKKMSSMGTAMTVLAVLTSCKKVECRERFQDLGKEIACH